jgi:hypothetical protein
MVVVMGLKQYSFYVPNHSGLLRVGKVPHQSPETNWITYGIVGHSSHSGYREKDCLKP